MTLEEMKEAKRQFEEVRDRLMRNGRAAVCNLEARDCHEMAKQLDGAATYLKESRLLPAMPATHDAAQALLARVRAERLDGEHLCSLDVDSNIIELLCTAVLALSSPSETIP